MLRGVSPKTVLKAATVTSLLTFAASGLLDAQHLEAGNKAAAKTLPEPVILEPHLGHARIYFRRHAYRTALIALGNRLENVEALFIAAESNFRLKKFGDAQRLYEKIIAETKDPIERRKAQIRLFDIDIKTQDTQAAINRYVAFNKEYKKPTAQMRYGLGKALFDIGHVERAEKILRAVPKDSEFFMRASYLVASLELDKKKPDVLVSTFHQIELLPPVSVEDYSIRQLAILAQGRIYAEMGKEDLAVQAYARVSLAGEFGETATVETIRTMLARANEARLKEGRYKRASDLRRRNVESESIAAALLTLTRYRKAQEIDWRKPELLTLMARLYVEAKRYDDARLAYQELIGHYRPLHDAMLQDKAEKEVWPYLALDFERNENKPRQSSMIPSVPSLFSRDISELNEVLTLRDRIEADENKLRGLEERAQNFGARNVNFVALRSQQNAIAAAYDAMVIKKQRDFRKEVAKRINSRLAEAEFNRAELVVIEMGDLKKQQNVVHDFQSKNIEAFEEYLRKLDEGGSS